MAAWFNWKTFVLSTLLGFGAAAALFGLSDRTFALSGLDLFFFATTVASIGFNLWQLFRDRYKYAPLKNAFIGLFNDLKSRQLRAHQRQVLITSPAGSTATADALRLEFYDFLEETKQGFEQLREHVVAAIHTLDPAASTQQVFRSAEFGLNEQERRHRLEGLERYIQGSRAAGSGIPESGSPTKGSPAERQANGASDPTPST